MKKILFVLSFLVFSVACNEFCPKDDFGRRCDSYRTKWICSDDCSCYRSCARSAIENGQFTYEYAMDLCLRNVCRDYKLVCAD